MTKQQALELAVKFRNMAETTDSWAKMFDIGGTECECCEAFRYNDFGQKRHYDRVIGVGERLREIADSMEKRLSPTLEDEAK